MNRSEPDRESVCEAVRLDRWLWAARWFRSRALAQQAIEGGKVEVEGTRPRSSRRLRGGERMTIQRGEERFEIEVLRLATRRLPASQAALLYRELPESQARRARLRAERAAAPRPPHARPSGRERELLRTLKRR